MQVKQLVNYWLKTAEHDFETMKSLYKTKRYSDCLFFGHIILEKVLKALVVQKTKKEAPRIHDLTRLLALAGVNLSEAEIDLLDQVNDFNIRCRYPEYKLSFYKKCTKEYTEVYLKKIITLYKKLCQKIK